MSEIKENCANCGRPIGRLETPRVWNDSAVCGECHQRLSHDSTVQSNANHEGLAREIAYEAESYARQNEAESGWHARSRSNQIGKASGVGKDVRFIRNVVELVVVIVGIIIALSILGAIVASFQ